MSGNRSRQARIALGARKGCGMVEHITHVWKTALTENDPCGEDISFSPEFEALKNEVEKDTSLYASEGTDWDLVLRMSTELLSTRSKDLWVLVYAVYAVYHTQGFAACPEALACLNTLLEKYWDALYPLPTRIQRRIAPLQWLQSRMVHCAGGTGFSGEKPEYVTLLKAQFVRLQAMLEARAGDLAPSFMAAFSNVTVAADADQRPEEEGEAAGKAGELPQSATASPALGAALSGMDADGRVPSAVLPQLVRNVMEQARQLAGHFLSLDLLDERAYQLHRTALWSTLLHLPPADNAGVTQMACGVPKEKTQNYATALENRQYESVLPQLERSAAKAPYWLDGHYMVARCLEALGATAAHNCVKSALAQLLGRFPDLLNFRFKNGTPFASPKVIPWLEALQSAQPVGAAQAFAAGRASGDAPEEESRLQEAIALCIEEDFHAGLRHLGSLPAGRNRATLLHGLLQARYCLATGKKAAAHRLLQAMYRRLEQWDLLDWEPELSARIITLLLSAQSKPPAAEAEEMSRRLHWLSLDTAIGVLQET